MELTIAGTCHCRAVAISVARAPIEVTSCNCSICHRLGTLWAYYATSDVQITGPTATYRWGDKTIDFHRCVSCGCTTHWSPLPEREERDRLGINARLLAPEVLAAARIRRLDGASDDWQYLDE
ncbi:MAG: GFA family protein [Kofleriaceae bacterium]